MENNKSGCLGSILSFIGFIAGLILLRRFFPSLWSVLLGIVGFIAVLIAALIALILWLIFRKPKPGSPQAIKAENKKILSQARSSLAELKQLGMRVKNSEVRILNTQICSSVDKILKTLKEKPESIPTVRQFLNYYLPTLESILTKYVRVEESGVPSGDMTQSVVTHLGEIKTAMEKQYANLFDDDLLDLSVEIEALTLACKRDGLLSDDDFKPADEGGDINLTL